MTRLLSGPDHAALPLGGLLTLAAALAACWAPVEDPPTEPAVSDDAELATVGTLVTDMDPRIWSLLQAANGDLWIGSNGAGVYRHDGEQLVHYDEDDGLVGLQVRDLAEHGNGDVLIATYTGVTRFDGRALEAVEVTELGPGEGWELDPDDTWLEFEPGSRGPSRYDGEKVVTLELTGSPGAEVHARAFSGIGFPTTGIYSIHVDRRGHLWFGTAAAGLCRFDGERLDWLYEEQLTTTPAGGSFGIRSIHEEAGGRFWLGNTRQRYEVAREGVASEGLRLLDTEKVAGLPGPMQGPDSNLAYIHDIAEDARGVLWMAVGEDGVWRVEGEAVTKHALPDEAYAFSLLLGDAGRLWVGTVEDGVYVFDGERFAPFAPFGSD